MFVGSPELSGRASSVAYPGGQSRGAGRRSVGLIGSAGTKSQFPPQFTEAGGGPEWVCAESVGSICVCEVARGHHSVCRVALTHHTASPKGTSASGKGVEPAGKAWGTRMWDRGWRAGLGFSTCQMTRVNRISPGSPLVPMFLKAGRGAHRTGQRLQDIHHLVARDHPREWGAQEKGRGEAQRALPGNEAGGP